MWKKQKENKKEELQINASTKMSKKKKKKLGENIFIRGEKLRN